MANKAAGELGCGAAPLPVPTAKIRAKAVSGRSAKGTPCAAFSSWPVPATGWTVDIRTSTAGPVGSCFLRQSGQDENGPVNEPVAELNSWYGDWAESQPYVPARRDKASREFAKHGARLTKDAAWATARCDGHPATFRVRQEASALKEADDGSCALRSAGLRSALERFAKDRMASRDCSGLRLPPSGAASRR